MTLNRRKFLATTAAATATAAIGTPMIVRAQPAEYIFGASLPLTGPFATAGQAVVPAFEISQALINENGGIGGVPLRFIIEDTGYVPQNNLSNFQRALAQYGEDLIGYFCDGTGGMKLISSELTGANARLCGSASFASELADPVNHPYQYMSGPTYESQIDIALNTIAAAGGNRVAFIFSNTEFGRDPIEHGKRTAEALGLEIVLEEATKPQGADIATHVTKLAQSGAEHCILQGYVASVWPQIIGGARQFGLPTQFYGTFWGMEKFIADRITEQAGPILEGYQGVMPYFYDYQAEEGSIYNVYRAKAQEMMPDASISQYISTWALQAFFGIALAQRVFDDILAADKPITADNCAEAMAGIKGWDTQGFFGGPIDVVDNAVPTGRVYQYSTETRLFSPVSDWLTIS